MNIKTICSEEEKQYLKLTKFNLLINIKMPHYDI